MSNKKENTTEITSENSIESVLLDAELFVKYNSPEKAFERLNDAIQKSPRSIQLREKLREIFVSMRKHSEASLECLALVEPYITKENFDLAYDRLQEAKLLDPKISVARGLDAIRKARRPELGYANREHRTTEVKTNLTLSGDLFYIGIFDVIQVIENNRLTGTLAMKSDSFDASIFFNEGKIADAAFSELNGIRAFRFIIELTEGSFEFTISTVEFPTIISVSSNTNFLLEVLTQLETEKEENQKNKAQF